MKFRIDYHMHPTLPRSRKRALARCRAWWRAAAKSGINVLVVTEHAFARPQRAFQLMRETMPEGMHVFPGMEYLTKERVDLVIFSDDERIYDCPELQPYRMTCDEAVNFIKEQDFSGFFPHPILPFSSGSVVKYVGLKKYKELLDRLGGVEVSNDSFDYKVLFSHPRALKHIFSEAVLEATRESVRLPKRFWPHHPALLAVSSDAHYPNELGSYLEIDCPRDELYQQLRHNHDLEFHAAMYNRIHPYHLLRVGLHTLVEHFVRLRIKRKLAFQ